MKENKVIAYSFLLAFILWFLPFVLRLFVVEIPQMDILLLEEKFPQIENSAIHETINLLSAGDKLGAFWAIFKNNLKGCVINSTGGVFFGLGTLFNLVFNGFFSADMFASSYRNGMSIPAIL
ncbi:MAG: stage II sporulation protein M, partial [Dysgonamonadaceae bacterium]|nr:stage II sporulation protein M [Dysgonamonadaceae bacterium]